VLAPGAPHPGAGRPLELARRRRLHPAAARAWTRRRPTTGALATLGLATDPLTQNTYSLAGGNPVSHVEWDGHMLIADGGAFAESGGWAQGQLLERIPAENFGKGVLLGP